MFPSSDYRYRRSVDVRFGCRNDGFGGDNYIFNKGEEKVPLLKYDNDLTNTIYSNIRAYTGKIVLNQEQRRF